MPPATQYAKSGELFIAYQVTGDGPVDLIWAAGATSHLRAAARAHGRIDPVSQCGYDLVLSALGSKRAIAFAPKSVMVATFAP